MMDDDSEVSGHIHVGARDEVSSSDQETRMSTIKVQ